MNENSTTPPEPVVIAEIGCNHCGRVDTAKALIHEAAKAGAKFVKFQKRNPRECLTPEQYIQPYENPHSYGATYGEHREKLEFTIDVHADLKEFAEDLGLGYSASVWDLTSAREIAGLEPDYIKIPSARNHQLDLLKYLRDHYAGAVHVSVGMSEESEIDEAVGIFGDCPERLVLYSCTSGYPVDAEDVCLFEINKLRERYEGRVAEIGFSGHHKGIAIDVAAYTLGARLIERHFTLDRTWKGTDHAASLEPQGLAKLARDLNTVRKAMSLKQTPILPVEAVQRVKLKGTPIKQN